MPVKSGRGLFADALVTRFPLLPVEEEGRLNDPRLRENFIERVFAYRRLTTLFVARWSMGDVVRFHTAHKLTLMAHQPAAYQRLGRLVASGKTQVRREFQERYSTEFMSPFLSISGALPLSHRGARRPPTGSQSRAASPTLVLVVADMPRTSRTSWVSADG